MMDNDAMLVELLKDKTGPVPVRAKEARRLTMRAELRKVTQRIAALKMEALRLYLPLPAAEAFHASTAKWRVIDGSNRAGKTLAAAAEAARAWLGCDPYDKYPRTNGNSLVVGLDGDHIAMMWKKCAEPGAFSMIRDEKTKLWRAVRPDPAVPTQLDPYDDAYREKWREAPPLIPPRMIAGRVAWDDKAKGIPRYVKFTTGWTSLWRSSEGKSPQGEHFNLAWIDEQITNEQFYLEACRGLVGLGEPDKHKPRGIWSATPQTTNPQLLDLRESADAGSEGNNAFQLLIDDNPFIPFAEKRAFFESLSDDEREVRYYGRYAITGRRIYPTYNPMGIHGCEPFEIPPHWTRYVWVDPGRQHCGCLFFAIDPDERHVYAYDGFDLRNGTAQKWAVEVRKRETRHSFEAFGIDQQMGRETPVGQAANIASHYFQALMEADVRPRTLGPLRGFFPGSPDVPAREEALLRWLEIRGDGPFAGTPKLQVFRGAVPDLDRQFHRAHMDHKRRDTRAKLLSQPEDILVCFDDQTEVLTENAGWQRFASLYKTERLATVNLQTDELEYQTPSRYIDIPHSGDMIKLSGKRLDAMVTPNHRMVVYPRGEDETPTFCKAANLRLQDRLKIHAHWTGQSPEVILIPRVPGGMGQEKELNPMLWAEFLGWYISEGCCDKTPRCPGNGYRVTISQCKPSGRALVGSLLDQLPWKWTSQKHGFSCSSKQLWAFLFPLGNSYTKRVPRWIARADTETIRRFVTSMILGDGWIQYNIRSYSSVNPHLTDDMQELFIKLGRSARVYSRAAKPWSIRGKTGYSREQHCLTEWIQPRAGLCDHDRNPKFSEVPYDGRVYCATVPNSTLIVRRNGRPLVAGNCAEYFAAFGPKYHEPVLRVEEPENPVYDAMMRKKRRQPQLSSAELG